MTTDYIIVCELKGSENSNPTILDSYPLDIDDEISKKMVPKFLPFGSRAGDYLINTIKKNVVLSYIFKIKNMEYRDDLLSISIILEKKENVEIYKQVLKKIIDSLEENSMLTEEMLRDHLVEIYRGVYEKKDVEINNMTIELSKIFEEARLLYEIKKPKIKGSFSI